MIAPAIPENEARRLKELFSLGLEAPEKKSHLEGVVTILSKCLGVPIAYISTIESTTQNIHSSCGLNFDSSDRSTSFCGHTILQQELIIVEDTLEDERFHDNPMVVNEPNLRFYAGYPLSSITGCNIGSLCVADTKPRKLNLSEIEILNTLGQLLNERIRAFKLSDIQKEIKESQAHLEMLNSELTQSNKFYQQLFGQYMSESLLEQVLINKKGTQLGGEEKKVTVLVSDLRKFSPISEKYPPNVVIEILNVYLEEMIRIIHRHEGYINEILGDGILVIFGAPKAIESAPLKAVQCARDMQRGINKVNKKLRIKGLPSLEMGIGINSGNLVVGNIGSKRRMKYGVVGETINIASRIESLTIPGQILVSESIFEEISGDIKAIGNIRTTIKGFKYPIKIYDVSELD